MATLLELRNRIRQRTDNEHSGSEFVTDAELTQLINKSRNELFGILVQAGLHSTPESETTITQDGSAAYALPDDMFAIQAVFHDYGTGAPRRLSRHDHRVRASTQSYAHSTTYRVKGYRTDAQIEFNPRADNGDYIVVYVAAPTDLSADGDTVDGILGWEEYIVLDVSVDVMMKEGVPGEMIDRMLAMKNEMAARIKREANMRDLSENHTVADVRMRNVGSLIDEFGFIPGDYYVRGFRGRF